MTTTEVLMIDATHKSVHNIPARTPKVGGYTTGSKDIQWTADDWALFPDAGHVRIEQGFIQDVSHILGCDVLDIEAGAFTPAGAAQSVKLRMEHGIKHTGLYGSDGKIAATVKAMDAISFGKPKWYIGHAGLWLADWNLSQAEATARLGTKIHGLTCHAVQWASPTSNPHTQVPGSLLTLAEANVDLSVTEPGWHAHTATPAALRGLLVRARPLSGALFSTEVVSADGGKSWLPVGH